MSSVFKIYSPEDCDFYYDGELQGHIEGNSKKAFRFEVERKGVYRLEFINSEYQTELMMKVSIDADEEREVELDFSEVNEPVIRRRIIAIEHDYEKGEQLPEEIISAISKNGFITIPKGVRKIGNRAFFDCKKITSITIPDSVTEIGEASFANCKLLTSITIPDSITKIGDSAFFWCLLLKSIIMPNTITKIGKFAFCNCCYLTSITIPDSVTEIGDYAFYDCCSLASITIPDSVTKIGERAFSDCSSLTDITIPNSVTKIGDSAFSGCSSLTDITIPDSVTEIGNSAFSGCSRLTAFYGKYASNDNRCLIKDGRLLAFAPDNITEYTIPNSVTEIGNSAFSGCSSLTDITIPNSVTEIRYWAFSDCSSLTDITIPDSVTKIGDSAFSGCSRLIAFYGKYASNDNRCLIKDGRLLAFAPDNITEYTIPNSVTMILGAFSGCSSLTSITIPDSVTEIGDSAFYNCLSLTSVYCKATTPPNKHSLDFRKRTFKNNSSDRKIYVPKSEDSTILEEYKLAHIWKEYKDDIYEYDFDNE